MIEINNLNYETAKQNFMLNIGYVSQSVYLADDSVFYNISLNIFTFLYGIYIFTNTIFKLL